MPVGDGAAPATGLGRSLSQGSQPQGRRQAAADHAGPEAAGWEKEAEARRLWQREEAALYQFRRADVTARGRRSQADRRQAVVTREEAGLRLAEELSAAPNAAEDGGLSTHMLHMTRLHAKRPLLV